MELRTDCETKQTTESETVKRKMSETVLMKDHSLAKRLVRTTESETVQLTVGRMEPQKGLSTEQRSVS